MKKATLIPSGSSRRITMQLSADELTRLDMMFRSCHVTSNPPVLSDTDRMLDAMRPSEAASGDNAPRPGASSRSDIRPSSTTARTLDELIHIRRGLMRNKEQQREGTAIYKPVQ